MAWASMKAETWKIEIFLRLGSSISVSNFQGHRPRTRFRRLVHPPLSSIFDGIDLDLDFRWLGSSISSSSTHPLPSATPIPAQAHTQPHSNPCPRPFFVILIRIVCATEGENERRNLDTQRKGERDGRD